MATQDNETMGDVMLTIREYNSIIAVLRKYRSGEEFLLRDIARKSGVAKEKVEIVVHGFYNYGWLRRRTVLQCERCGHIILGSDCYNCDSICEPAPENEAQLYWIGGTGLLFFDEPYLPSDFKQFIVEEREKESRARFESVVDKVLSACKIYTRDLLYFHNESIFSAHIIAASFDIDLADVVKALGILAGRGMVKIVCELICPTCEQSNGIITDTVNMECIDIACSSCKSEFENDVLNVQTAYELTNIGRS